MRPKHLDDMFSKEFYRNPPYFIQISAIFTGSLASCKLPRTISEVHSEIGRLRVIGSYGWKLERDGRILDGATIVFVHVSLKSVGNFKTSSRNTSIGRGRFCMGQGPYA